MSFLSPHWVSQRSSARSPSGPSYVQVFLTFARNSLIRDMTFRSNFFIQVVSSLSWVVMNLGFYLLIYSYTRQIGDWSQYEFFAFVATTMMINGLVQTFFMPNIAEFSELIRTGGLDFALLKPIDTQFLISLQRIEWSSMANVLFGMLLLTVSVWQMPYTPPLAMVILYPAFLICGALIFYSLMIALAATSIWFGRNQSLYDFWFYITIFSRYPMEIYQGGVGFWVRLVFTYAVPILVVVNVPARLVAKQMSQQYWLLTAFAILAAAMSLWSSRQAFRWALSNYRSASS